MTVLRFLGWRGGIAVLLAIALGISIIALKAEQRHSGKLQVRIGELTAQLEAISIAKNEQVKTTDRNIAKANKGQAEAKVVTRIIHDAPLPANCETPALDTAKAVL
jgi:uncharacterized protein HemX